MTVISSSTPALHRRTAPRWPKDVRPRGPRRRDDVTPGTRRWVATLYEMHRDFVHRRIQRFYRGPESREVLQEVFVRVLEKRHHFDGTCSAKTWLWRLTTNHCINRLRNENRRRVLWSEHASASPLDVDLRRHQEARIFLGELWRNLDPEVGVIALLHYRDGLSHDDIAREFGCSRRTIGNRLEHLRRAAWRAVDEYVAGRV